VEEGGDGAEEESGGVPEGAVGGVGLCGVLGGDGPDGKEGRAWAGCRRGEAGLADEWGAGRRGWSGESVRG